MTTEKYIRLAKDPIAFLDEAWYGFNVQTFKMDKINPHEFQRELVRSVYKRDIHLIAKSRQMYVTTTMCAYIAWLIAFHPNKKVIVISNNYNQTSELLNIIRRILEYAELADFTISNKKEIQLQNESYVKAVVPNAHAGKGEMVDFVYIDEAAFIKNFELIYTSIHMCLNPTDGFMVAASTPYNNSDFNRHYNYAVETFGCSYLKLDWTQHPVYSEGMRTVMDEKGRLRLTSPWYEDMKVRMHPGSIESELDCVIRVNDKLSKSETISLRLSPELNTRIREKIGTRSISDYIRELIEQDIR